MYKRRYTNSKLKKAIKAFDEEEESKEQANLHTLETEVKKIVKHDEPIQKLHKKIKKDAKSKPIDTRVLLHGFI